MNLSPYFAINRRTFCLPYCNMNIRWVHQMWLRILALVLAAGLTAFGLISISAVPLWPVVGVTVATLALCWNSMTSRLDKPLCLNCGDELNQAVGTQYGIICNSCGCLNEPIGEIPVADSTTKDRPYKTSIAAADSPSQLINSVTAHSTPAQSHANRNA